MSNTPGNISMNSIVLNTQNRSDFIEKFKQHQFQNNDQKKRSNNHGRWDYLHDLSKLQKMKLEEQRQKIQNEQEDVIFNECTFSPKLNKSFNYSQCNQLTNPSRLETDPNIGILGRQEAWNQKKCLHIEALKQNKNTKELDQCFFNPEINPPNKLNKSKLKNATIKVVEDPESYNLYISRLERKRKEDNSKIQRQKSLPGSGNVWSSKPKNYNLSYDYTKHENVAKYQTKQNTISSLRKPTTPKKFSSKTIISPNSNLKRKEKQLNNKDLYYDYMYNSERGKGTTIDPKYTKQGNDFNGNNCQNIKLDDQIEFAQAIDLLHNELYSFPLMTDDE